MAEKYKDAEFLEFIVKSLVDVPDAVIVERKVDEMGVLLNLKIDPQDMGKIIGRNGNTAKSIRNLLRVVGLKNHARVNLKIEEPEGSTRGSSRPAPEQSTSEQSVTEQSVDDVVDDLKL